MAIAAWHNVEQCGPDEWYVCVEVRELAVHGRLVSGRIRSAGGRAEKAQTCAKRTLLPAIVRTQQPPQPRPHADQRLTVDEPLKILPLCFGKKQHIQDQALILLWPTSYTRRPD